MFANLVGLVGSYLVWTILAWFGVCGVVAAKCVVCIIGIG